MSVVFADRQSKYPNRYKITREDGTEEYINLDRADEPTAEGTPLNAATLNGAFKKIRDEAVFYELTKSGSTITLTGSDGSKTSVADDGVGEETSQSGEIFNDKNNVANGKYDSASGFESKASSYVIPLKVDKISGSTYTFLFMPNIPAENKTIITDFVNSGKVKLIAHAPETEDEYQCFMTKAVTGNGFTATATTEQDQFLSPVEHSVGATLWAWFPLCPEAGYYQDTYDMPGYAAHAHGYENTATGKGAAALGTGTRAAGHSAFAEGAHTYATIGAHAEGVKNHAIGQNSHAEGRETLAKGVYSHAEGGLTEALGLGSHAEGRQTVASGKYAHSEGNKTTASGDFSHTEGSNNVASGVASHAGGARANAVGDYSFAHGRYVDANHEAQAVFGKYNKNKESNLLEVGNGTSDNRSNAFEVDKNGNLKCAGDVTDGRGNSFASLMAMVDFVLSKVPMSFSLHNKPCEAKYGMTWAEWCDSDYNTDGFYVDSDNRVAASEDSHVSTNGVAVEKGTDTIIADGVYYIYQM